MYRVIGWNKPFFAPKGEEIKSQKVWETENKLLSKIYEFISKHKYDNTTWEEVK